jgi:Lon protease-like protein
MAALNIPEFSGVMLLPDCTLFPHGALPLHIFESRYQVMLENALEGDCLFCVTRLIADEGPKLANCAAPVGTIGLIRASREQDSGTSDLILHGVIRVRFDYWVDTWPYPFAHITPLASIGASSPETTALVGPLREAVRHAVAGFPVEIGEAVDALMQRADDPVILADIVSQQFLRDPDERQLVLEIEAVAERINYLLAFLGRGLL